VVAAGEDGASAIIGADRVAAIVDVACVELAMLCEASPRLLLPGVADASCLRATLIGSEVARVTEGSTATADRAGLDERFAMDASGFCCALRVMIESA
jgi:hypothetical protein